ncbi:MAG: glycoside hydrolase family 28 protein [Planctomycetota bacterium]|nr:MAG: glycoside hydrolase family 28 protein [Planctomycetota bacterium]
MWRAISVYRSMQGRTTLSIIILLCTMGTAMSSDNDVTIPSWDDVPQLVAAIAVPDIPARSFSVEQFGAVGDGDADDRPAIMAALAHAAAVGGGRVLLSGGRTWYSKGPLHLYSNIELHIAEGAVLRFSSDPNDYLPQVLTRWEGTEVFNYSPFIYAYQASNVALTGSGTIDGNATDTFGTWRAQQNPGKQRLRQMGAEQVPVFSRVFGDGDYLRPSMIQFFACSQVLIEDVSVVDSPFWVVHLVASKDVTVRGIRVDSRRLNNDGVDIESTSNVLIENSHFQTGDDSIVIKAGRDNDGRRLARPSERIVIRNNFMQGHNALAIGSEMSAGVRHVFMENNQLGAVHSPLYIKSSTERGGIVEHIHIRNITVESSINPLIRLIMNYQRQTKGNHIPIFRHITMENIVAEQVADLFEFSGHEQEPLRHIHIRNVQVGATATVDDQVLSAGLVIDTAASHMRDSTIENISVGGKALPIVLE